MPAAAPVSAVFLCCAAFTAPAFFLFLQIPLYGFYVYFPAGESFLSIFLAYILTLRIPLRGVRFFLADSLQSFCIHIPQRVLFFVCSHVQRLERVPENTKTANTCAAERIQQGSMRAFFEFPFGSAHVHVRAAYFFAVREKMGRPLKKNAERGVIFCCWGS